MNNIITSIVVHLPLEDHQTTSQVFYTIQSILDQTNPRFELILLQERNDITQIMEQLKIICPFQIIPKQDLSYPSHFNRAIKTAKGDYILYCDNREGSIYLKRAALETLLMTVRRNPGTGMVYSDYELDDGNKVENVGLLKHHRGRLRDNQDYGKVFLFSKRALKSAGLFDERLRYNIFYDIRLKIAEKFELVHIANKSDGALYHVVSPGKEFNVFDYLIAGREVQLEAEEILTAHLKRIGAYLSPGDCYRKRESFADEFPLKASIIIPVNNRPQFIGHAIESVLNQTVQDIEVIVIVNGGEDDPTSSEVKRYQHGGDLYNPDKPDVILKVIDINNIGLCLNLGVEIARGKYYVQLDSDDRLKPDAVEKITAVFDSDPCIGMVIGSYEVWEKRNDTGEIVRLEDIPVVTHDEWTEENGRNNLLRINGAGAPRSIPIHIIKEMGYFGINDAPFARNYGEDYDMVLRISERYRIGRIYEPIYEVIRHSGGTDHSIDQPTIDRNDEAKDWMRLEAIRRRQKLNYGK